MKKTIFLTLMSRLGPDEVPDEWVLALLDGAGPPETKSVRDIAREAADEAQLAWVRVRNLEPKPKPVPPPSSGTETWQEQPARTGSMPTWAQSKVEPEPEPEPEPGTVASMSKHWEDGTGPYADCGGEKGRPKTKIRTPIPPSQTFDEMRSARSKPRQVPKTHSIDCLSGQCPCETERGVRCPNPTVEGTRRCKEHSGLQLGFYLSGPQRRLLAASFHKKSVPVRGKLILRSVAGLVSKGLIDYAHPLSPSRAGRVTITAWGIEVIAGFRLW